MDRYVFGSHADFLDRTAELQALESWWNDDSDRFPLVLFGRRRVGKSWLFRQFAHGRPADVFVCDRLAEADQLWAFAGGLEGRLGVRPHFPDVASFYQFLFRQARDERRLAVIDEFPELLRLGGRPDSVLARVMEDELHRSRLKLILCGSQVSTMERLMTERQPLRGRGRRLLLPPLRFPDAAAAFLGGHDPAELVTRYAVAGGMPLYLRRLGRAGPLRTIVCEDLLQPLAPFFNEPWEVLEKELVGTAVHFSLLRALSRHQDMTWQELLAESRVSEGNASRNIRVLQDLHLVEAANPMFSEPSARQRRYRLRDHLMRFWFRFVFPWQEELQAGLSARDHYDHNVAPQLAEHVSPVFEDVCRTWVRLTRPDTADAVGRWWGPARHDLRRREVRMSEEIDVVAASGRRVSVIGECKWTGQPMRRRVLDDLLEHKVPALAQVGVDVGQAQIVLFSRSGFAPDLRAAAGERDVRLVDLGQLVADLVPGGQPA
jgi:AAA+ ATPase superfamily predicted ATPase